MSRSLQPVPILDSLGEVFRGFFQHIRYLPRLALLPFTFSFGLIVLKFLTQSQPLLLLLNLADILPVALFSFLWFRLLLYGPNPETLRPLPPFDEAFRRFLIYNLMLLAPLLVLQEMMPVPPPPGSDPAQIEAQAQDQMGMMLFLLPLLFLYIVVMAGMSFLFPATAAGKVYGPRDSWQDTRGVKFAIFMILTLAVFPVLLAIELLSIPFDWIQILAGLVVPQLLLVAVAGYVLQSLVTGVLTQAYRIRFGWTPPPPSTT